MCLGTTRRATACADPRAHEDHMLSSKSEQSHCDSRHGSNITFVSHQQLEFGEETRLHANRVSRPKIEVLLICVRPKSDHFLDPSGGGGGGQKLNAFSARAASPLRTHFDTSTRRGGTPISGAQGPDSERRYRFSGPKNMTRGHRDMSESGHAHASHGSEVHHHFVCQCQNHHISNST